MVNSNSLHAFLALGIKEFECLRVCDLVHMTFLCYALGIQPARDQIDVASHMQAPYAWPSFV